MARRSIGNRIIGLLKWVLGTLALLAILITAFVFLAPTFGSNPTGKSLERIKSSAHYKNERLHNLVETTLDTRDPTKPMDIATYFFPPEGKNPVDPLPSVKSDLSQMEDGQFVWLGHSTVLFRDNNQVVLTDPVFHRASPVPFIGDPFPMQESTAISDLPEIDVILISHDHYDHLDHLAIAQLERKTRQFLVPLGIAAHLMRWGVPEDKIVELEWYESHSRQSTQFTLTPSRHFSGRGLTNRFSTLWGSWVIKSQSLSVFFSGDTGYFDELLKIGQQYGPFDIAFIENGAYSDDWSQIHMMPEESAQAAIDLQAKVFFPIHWSKFDLAQHSWDDPIIRASVAAERLGVQIATPLIGEVFTPEEIPNTDWWK